jgi:endonuclease YncB( thermonuclease family)
VHIAAATAAELFGKVVAVSDGDSITLLDASQQQHKIRLAGIDAPERRQAFGETSKQHLMQLVHGRSAMVVWTKRDRYGRIVGRVLAAECEAPGCRYTVDVGLEQLRVGLAWHYKRYEQEQPPAERMQYAALEQQARARRDGLWHDPHAAPPWDFRRKDGGTRTNAPVDVPNVRATAAATTKPVSTVGGQ